MKIRNGGGEVRGRHHCKNLRKLGLQFTRFELKVEKDIRVWSSEEVNHHRLIFLMYVTYLEKNVTCGIEFRIYQIMAAEKASIEIFMK